MRFLISATMPPSGNAPQPAEDDAVAGRRGEIEQREGDVEERAGRHRAVQAGEPRAEQLARRARRSSRASARAPRIIGQRLRMRLDRLQRRRYRARAAATVDDRRPEPVRFRGIHLEHPLAPRSDLGLCAALPAALRARNTSRGDPTRRTTCGCFSRPPHRAVGMAPHDKMPSRADHILTFAQTLARRRGRARAAAAGAAAGSAAGRRVTLVIGDASGPLAAELPAGVERRAAGLGGDDRALAAALPGIVARAAARRDLLPRQPLYRRRGLDAAAAGRGLPADRRQDVERARPRRSRRARRRAAYRRGCGCIRASSTRRRDDPGDGGRGGARDADRARRRSR